jgi:hypothetical protein
MIYEWPPEFAVEAPDFYWVAKHGISVAGHSKSCRSLRLAPRFQRGRCGISSRPFTALVFDITRKSATSTCLPKLLA